MSAPESDLEDRTDRQVAASIAVFVLMTLSMLAACCEAAIGSRVSGLASLGFAILTVMLCMLFIAIRTGRS